MLSPFSRLRLLVSRAVVRPPPLPPQQQQRVQQQVSEAPEQDDHVSVVRRSSDAAWDRVGWNDDVERLLRSVSSLGHGVARPSDWARIKRSCMAHVASLDPQTALKCLRTFARHRVCGKTEAMRLQEVIARSYDSQGFHVSDKVLLLHTLSTLRVALAPALFPHVLKSLPSLVEQCSKQMMPRLVYAVGVLVVCPSPGVSLGCTVATAADREALVEAMVNRAVRDRLLGLLPSERIYLLWALGNLVAHTPRIAPAFVAFLCQALGIHPDNEDAHPPSASDSSITSLRGSGPVTRCRIRDPITVDMLLGKTSTSNQLQPKDTVLLVHTLCSAVFVATRGGCATLGPIFYDHRRQRNAIGTPLVDASLLDGADGDDSLSSSSVACLKPHLDAACHRLCVALLSCELSNMDVALKLLHAVSQSGVVYWGTSVQLLMHLLVRFVLFRYRDSVFFQPNTMAPTTSAIPSVDADAVFSGLTLLRDAPTLTELERTRLIHARLSTNVGWLKQLLRPSMTEEELTVLLSAVAACREILTHSNVASSSDDSASESNPTPTDKHNPHTNVERTTFFGVYCALIAVKLQRALQVATPIGLARLIIAACKCHVLTAATVDVCIQRLQLVSGVSLELRQTSCDALLRYVKNNAAELWSKDTPPPSVVNKLLGFAVGENNETSLLLASICDAASNPSRHGEMEPLWLAVLRKRGTAAAAPSEVRIALTYMAMHRVAVFAQPTFQTAAKQLLQRAAHGVPAPLEGLMQLLLVAQRVGMLPIAVGPLADVVHQLLCEATTSQQRQQQQQQQQEQEQDDGSAASTMLAVLRWMVVVQRFGIVSWWSTLPPSALSVLSSGFDAVASAASTATLACLPQSTLVEVLGAHFFLGEDHPRQLQHLIHSLQVGMEGGVAAATQATIVHCVLMSWRGSRWAVRELLPFWIGPMQMAVRGILGGGDADGCARTHRITDGTTPTEPASSPSATATAVANLQNLRTVCAAATMVLRLAHDGPSCDPAAMASLRDDIGRCMRRLVGDSNGTFSLTRMTTLLNLPMTTAASSPCVLHAGAMCALVAQVMQNDGETGVVSSSGGSDANKLFAAQVWRQCIKHGEKMASTYAATTPIRADAYVPPLLGGQLRLAAAESPLTHLPVATVEDEEFDGIVLLMFVGILVRCGASSLALDTLVQKWRRRTRASSQRGSDLISVGVIAEGLLASGKRRPALTDFVAHCVEEGNADLPRVPSHLLAAMIEMTQRDAERVTLTLARAEGVGNILWAALELKLHRLPGLALLPLLQLVPAHALTAACQAAAGAIRSSAFESAEAQRAYVTLRDKGALSSDLRLVEDAVKQQASESPGAWAAAVNAIAPQ